MCVEDDNATSVVAHDLLGERINGERRYSDECADQGYDIASAEGLQQEDGSPGPATCFVINS